jgi:hypothetical protein
VTFGFNENIVAPQVKLSKMIVSVGEGDTRRSGSESEGHAICGSDFGLKRVVTFSTNTVYCRCDHNDIGELRDNSTYICRASSLYRVNMNPDNVTIFRLICIAWVYTANTNTSLAVFA